MKTNNQIEADIDSDEYSEIIQNNILDSKISLQ